MTDNEAKEARAIVIKAGLSCILSVILQDPICSGCGNRRLRRNCFAPSSTDECQRDVFARRKLMLKLERQTLASKPC